MGRLQNLLQATYKLVWDDIAHSCNDQVTAVKTGYPLTSIIWPYCGLKCRPIEVTCFLKSSADMFLVSTDRRLKIEGSTHTAHKTSCAYEPGAGLLHYHSHVDNRYKRSLLTTMLFQNFSFCTPVFVIRCPLPRFLLAWKTSGPLNRLAILAWFLTTQCHFHLMLIQ